MNGNSITQISRIPLAVKLVYSAFLAVLVPYYWMTYGPTNFLYYCDVALFLALAAVWLERPLLASLPTVGIFLPQMLWCVDFLAGLVGVEITGMTGYMFDARRPLFVRGLSLFHFWLPFFVLWMVWRLGYDRRALPGWTLLAWGLMLVCYFLMPGPTPDPADPNLPVNINYVHGLSSKHPQQWMPPLLFLGMQMVLLPLVIFLPTHAILDRWFGRRDEPCWITP